MADVTLHEAVTLSPPSAQRNEPRCGESVDPPRPPRPPPSGCRLPAGQVPGASASASCPKPFAREQLDSGRGPTWVLWTFRTCLQLGAGDTQPELPHPTRHVTGDRGGTSTLFDCFTVGKRKPIFIQRLCFVHVCVGFFCHLYNDEAESLSLFQAREKRRLSMARDAHGGRRASRASLPDGKPSARGRPLSAGSRDGSAACRGGQNPCVQRRGAQRLTRVCVRHVPDRFC